MGDNKEKKQYSKKLTWWQLALIGVGSIIGTGYFLGSSIAIKQGGPSVLIAFLFAGIGTYIVFNAMARMTAEHPEEGSFRTYAKQAFGRWAGFSNGWVYWSSEMLIMGSQLTALGLFSKYWFPNAPLWVLASIYGVLGLIVLLTGVGGFEKIENIFAVVKVAAIVMFIIIAGAGFFGFLSGQKEASAFAVNYNGLFPNGMIGLWSALIYAFYAFGGIEVMGIMATELKNPKDAPKSGKIMLLSLTTLYVISIALALMLVPWDHFSADESPFITALNDYHLAIIPDILNGALIIAGFSTMVASLYAITTMLVTLSKDGDAPTFFSKVGKRNLPIRALALTASGLVFSVVMSLLLPEKIFEYLATAAGLMLLYTWLFILFSFKKLMKLTLMDKIKRYFGLILVALGISGTLLHDISRPGFFVSLGFILVISVVTLFMRKKWKTSEET